MRLDETKNTYYTGLAYMLCHEHDVMAVAYDNGTPRLDGVVVRWLPRPKFVGEYSEEPYWNGGPLPRGTLAVLTFNAHYFATRDDAECTNTILHEIAHALTPLDSNHGDEWRTRFLAIGGDGEQYANTFSYMDTRWLRVCDCGTTSYERKPRSQAALCDVCWTAPVYFFNGGTHDLVWQGSAEDLEQLTSKDVARFERALAADISM